MMRRALATLVTAGPQGLSAETLMEAVWGDHRARGGHLKTLMAKIRGVLPGRIPKGDAGRYRLALDPADTVDLDTFRALVRDGTTAEATGDPSGAAKLLGGALKLWGDPPLCDLNGDSEILRPLREGLLYERQAAMFMLLRVRMELGEHRDILADLRHELARDPLSEQLHGLFMTALHRSGQRAKALRHYESAVDLLLQETGSGPGQYLRQLRTEIDFDESPFPAAPSAPSESGVRGIPAQQLPPDVLDFTGRRDRIAELTTFLTPSADRAGVPTAAITGPPGVGKSALAVHVAHLLREHYPDGQIYVQLASLSERPRDTGEVLGDLLGSLGVPPGDLPTGNGQRTALVRSLLAGRRVLLLIDDVAAAHQVQPLLPGTAGCAVIVTSRIHLAGGGFRTFWLEPLSPAEGVALLADIIGRPRVTRERGAAYEVVAACGGLPLAVRIAGARLSVQHSWPIAYLAKRLTRRADGWLGELAADEMTISASIADSYTALPADARLAFRAVTLAGPGDFPEWQAAMLLGAADAGPVLETLTRHSLLVGTGIDPLGQPRYRMHDLLRQYGLERLAEHLDEEEVTIERLLLGWLELTSWASAAVACEPYLPPPAPLSRERFVSAATLALIEGDPDRWFATEIEGILAMIRLACERRRHRLACGLAMRVTAYLERKGRLRDAEDMWRDVIVAATAGGDAHVAAQARFRMVPLITRQPGGPERAVPILDSCVAVFTRMGDARSLGRVLSLRAFCRYKAAVARPGAGRLDLASGDADRARELAHTVGDEHTLFTAGRTTALIASARGLHAEAVGQAEAVVTMGERLRSHGVAASYDGFAVRALIRVLMAAQEYERALVLCEHGQALARRAAHASAEAACVERAGDALTALNRHAEAAERYGRAAELYEGDAAERRRASCQGKIIHTCAATRPPIGTPP
ncbi:BTAD domain-containing putative transcriptional regulator [Streptosporangium soli]|nr:NB-ARC domain-containing protein [Streptosporangium sp. KLBMP 9127]